MKIVCVPLTKKKKYQLYIVRYRDISWEPDFGAGTIQNSLYTVYRVCCVLFAIYLLRFFFSSVVFLLLYFGKREKDLLKSVLMLWVCRCAFQRHFSQFPSNVVSLFTFSKPKLLICWTVHFDWAAGLHIIEAIIVWESVTWKIATTTIQIVKIQVAATIASVASAIATVI